MMNETLRNDFTTHAMWQPMTHPAEPFGLPPKVIVEGEGMMVRDIDRREILDATAGGLWCVNLGYSSEPIKAAVADQLAKLPYYACFRGAVNDKAVELSHTLREWLEPDGMTRAFFTSGGSDSVETALRLARQYHKLRGDKDRVKFISLRNSYHGTHFGGASVNGNSRFKRMYEPLLPGCFSVPAPWVYRNPFGENDPKRLSDLCAAALEAEIQFQSPDTVAAFIMEPVLGAGGVIPPHESFMPKVREICSRHGILLIADEVICGFGRTGDVTGSRHWGVQPDMMCVAKGLTSGYFPMGACMISEQIAEVFESNRNQDGIIGHGYTYSGHPVGAAAALAALSETRRLKLPENAAARGDEFMTGMLALKAKHELIGDVRGGEGLLMAMELVAERATKIPASKDLMDRLYKRIYDNGVMVRISAHMIILSPALIIEPGQVTTVINAIDDALTSVRGA
ncbi:aminotransferase class III-fold pyridoxal phosphate-dependent enzyme [Thioclava sp. FR2]|uniref:aminotransferase class III-fold pyridoxal phosphate-dependent enzyme n=1 Tax=Thioclava sp. FR2 TaxID=3445780 RepID=UPI003EBBEFF5